MWKTPQDMWEEFKLVPKDKQEQWFIAAVKTVYNEGTNSYPWDTLPEGWVDFD